MDENWNQQITKFVEEIKEIQRDKTAFSLMDTVDANGYWSYSLLWNRFALEVGSWNSKTPSREV